MALSIDSASSAGCGGAISSAILSFSGVFGSGFRVVIVSSPLRIVN